MKYIISNKENTHLMTLIIFKEEKEALKIKRHYTNYWKKFNKENPTNKSPRYSAWKNSIIKEVNWKSNFSDFDIVLVNESNKIEKKSSSKILENLEQTKITKIVDKKIDKVYGDI